MGSPKGPGERKDGDPEDGKIASKRKTALCHKAGERVEKLVRKELERSRQAMLDGTGREEEMRRRAEEEAEREREIAPCERDGSHARDGGEKHRREGIGHQGNRKAHDAQARGLPTGYDKRKSEPTEPSGGTAKQHPNQGVGGHQGRTHQNGLFN